MMLSMLEITHQILVKNGKTDFIKVIAQGRETDLDFETARAGGGITAKEYCSRFCRGESPHIQLLIATKLGLLDWLTCSDPVQFYSVQARGLEKPVLL